MMNYPNVVVFCGFRDKETNESEKDFAYHILEALDKGEVTEQMNPGKKLTFVAPLFDKFNLVRELDEGSPVKESLKLIETADFAVVILPKRGDGTSEYALMEYALVCGARLPVIVIVEEGIRAHRLGFVAELNRWPKIDRERIKTDSAIQKSLYASFQSALKKFRLKKPFVNGLPTYKVDDFYRERLIPLVLNWHEVKIYNHSILPLCSSYNPACQDVHGNDAWEKFNGVQKNPSAQPHRALYFELEEALLCGNIERMKSLVDLIGRDEFSSTLLSRILNKSNIKDLSKNFDLTRYVSLVPSMDYSDNTNNEDQKRAIARNLSILLHMYRMQKWLKQKKRIRYHLFGFKSYNPYSVPTTIYAEQKDGTNGDKKLCAVWGFLRSGESIGYREVMEDAFIIGQNTKSVEVWGRHLAEVEKKLGEEKAVPLICPGDDADFEQFKKLVGKIMCLEIQKILVKRVWEDVLSVSHFDNLED